MSAISDTQPYTYVIGWTKFDKWYYGVQYNKNCHPNKLWKTYFTSSKRVKDFYKENGDPDIIQIRKIFNTPEEALNWEQRVLKRLKVKSNDRWLNVAIGKPTMLGKKHSEETKAKMRKPKPQGFGKKISDFQKNYERSKTHNENIGKALLGKKLSKESVQKRSKTYRERFEQGLYDIGSSRLGKKRGPYKKKVNHVGNI